MTEMTPSPQPGDPLGEQPMTRREWELAERVVELEGRLGEVSHSETMREIEVQAIRHELDLQMAYNRHLEQLLSERQLQIDWFRIHAGPLSSVAVMDEEDARLQLLAERQRISYRFVQRISRFRRLVSIAGRIGRRFGS